MRNWESALASAHLLHLLTCAKCRTLAIGGELESSFPRNRALAQAAEKIGFSASLAVQGDPRLAKSVSASAALLRRTFRASGMRIRPLLMA